MKNIFEHSNSSWVRYSDYEWRKAPDGYLYLLPTSDAVPDIYDPMEDAETLVLTAMNIGLMLMRRQPEDKIRNAIKDFALKYGLLGIMTALPTTVKFIEYEKVYFPKNELIRSESMETEDYLKLFFLFRNPDIVKKRFRIHMGRSGSDLYTSCPCVAKRPAGCGNELHARVRRTIRLDDRSIQGLGVCVSDNGVLLSGQGHAG